MAGNVTDYVKEFGSRPFSDFPMNHVDSLALCQLAYLKFDGLVPGVRERKPWVFLRELARNPDYDSLFSDERYAAENRALLEAMMDGERYRGLRLNDYVNLVVKEQEMQFSAVTFLLEDGTWYVAYRGTDETIVGWKEAFNMAFLSPTPGQEYSVRYLNMVMGRLGVPFFVGGHSKGGNLAVYAAMNCLGQIRRRIRGIYNMDGPGFRPEAQKNDRYENIREKIIKIVPHSSLIGKLFETGEHCLEVESKAFALAQHNPYSWQIEGGAFVPAPKEQKRGLVEHTVNAWLLTRSTEQMKVFVDTMYQVVSAAKAEDLIEFAADWRKNLGIVRAALKTVDEQTRKTLRETLRSFLKMARLCMKEALTDGKHRPEEPEKPLKPEKPEKPEEVSP
ncbi:MAG: DUF2974 domain-containing protein [Clostridium sp.]|jgi:hypothetical protein|nr:DUF2974 domain-containing protein [Clostridium sp.]